MDTYEEHLSRIKGLWPGPGVVLVASPHLNGTLFGKSVVVLCEANREGAIGLVLTIATTMTLGELVDTEIDLDYPLYQGGPVEINSLHFFHEDLGVDIGSKEIFPGIWWGLDYDRFMTYMADTKDASKEFRFFMGYSGWGPLQLEQEILRGDWFTTPASGDVLFNHDSTTLWDYTLRTMGPDYAALADAAKSMNDL